MNQWWQCWKKRFRPEYCDKVIEMAKQMPAVEATIGHGADKVVTDKDYRRSQLRWLPRFDSRFFGLFGDMELVFREANRNAFGFDLDLFHEVQFTEYHATNAGHYDWHHDTYWTGSKLIRRKLSMVVQLSDPADYDGGRLEFCPRDCNCPPEPDALLPRGTVIVFPSFLRHRVTPVTRGTRYSLVSWYEGPYFR
jgi:PKHD-type hydroxylase